MKFKRKIVLGCLLWAGAASLAWAGLRELFSPGLRAEVSTVRGETLWLDGIRLSTPADFKTLSANDPIARFSADTALPGGAQFFSRIQRINLGDLSTAYIGSNPQEMEYYRLGDPRNAVPPPPDWRHSIGQIPPWHRTAATPDLTGLPFINHAYYCWTQRAPDSGKDLGIYLFRQAMGIERADLVARATLRLGANVDLLEGYFNEHPLHLVGSQKPALAEFEVTPLVQEGNNVVALKVRGRGAVLSANYGIAFHLELARRKATGAPVEARDPSETLLSARAGDRIWGRPASLTAAGLTLATAYGNYRLAWDDCASLLFPGGWRAAGPRPNLAQKLLKKQAGAPAPEFTLYGLPVWMLPNRLHDCLLLTEGRVATARPDRVQGGRLFFEGEGSRPVSLPLEEVLGIFPPRPEKIPFRRPPRAVAVLYCQVATRAGENLLGLLRQVGPETVTLESESGMMTIPSGNVASIQFPYHAAMLAPAEASKGAIALAPQAGESERFRETYDEDSRRVQKAAFIIGADSKTLDPDWLGDAESLRPNRIPVLVCVDPVGEYLHTWKTNGDAQAALLKYVDDGGVIVALSRGGAFRAPLANLGGGRLGPVQAKPTLAEQLGLRTVRPSDPPAEGIEAFEQPSNECGDLFFQRGTQLPETLGALPRRIQLAPMELAPFYPMVVQGGGNELVVYAMADARGRAYGPALTLLPRGRGWIVVIDHLLWESGVDDRPFDERILPILLRWAMANAAH